MLFAQNKKRIALLLALLSAMLLFAIPALAEEPLSFSLSVEPASLTAPGPVTVSIRVVNNSGADMTEPVSVQDPAGEVVTAFGDNGQALIRDGEFRTAQYTYNVSQEQLDKGQLTYTLSYYQAEEDGEVVEHAQMQSVAIAYTGTNVDLIVNRNIDPKVVRNGSTVNVQYELYNAGNVEIKNIRVRENSSISRSNQTLPSLAPGERKTIQFTATMGNADLTSAGKVTYTADGETSTITLAEEKIPKANPGLVLGDVLTADKTSITEGEAVTLTLSIANNGNITYSNITVTDPTYGELFTNLTLGPGETLVRDKQFTLSETTTFKYTITLPDNTGTTNTVTSNEVKISVYDPSQVLVLAVTADSESATISSAPADVNFTLTVTNNSTFEAKDIALSHGPTRFYTIEKLAPSESVTITRAFTVSQAGKFRFTASAADPLKNTVSFDSNEIVLTYAPPVVTPTMAPIPTVAPLVTVTAAPIEVLEPVKLQTNGILRIAAYVLGGLFAASFLLFVISTVIRAKKHSASKNAYDHMELGEKRDYKEPARHPESFSDQEEPEDGMETIAPPAASETLPSDSILNEETPAVAENGEETVAYRLTREESSLFAPPAQQSQTAEPEPEQQPQADSAPAEQASLPEDIPLPPPVKPISLDHVEEITPQLVSKADQTPIKEKAQRHRRANRSADAPSEDE